MNDNDIIMSALQQGILEAFFTQQTRYDSNDQPRIYGGQIAQVVDTAMHSPEFKAVIASITKKITKSGSKLEERIIKGIEDHAYESVTAGLNSGHRYDHKFDNYLKNGLQEKAEKHLAKLIENDKSILDQVDDIYKNKDYKINVSVNVSVIRNPEPIAG